MRAFRGFTILVARADHTPVLAPVGGGAAHCALAFTAPDRSEAYVATLPPETRAAVEGAAVEGAALFGHLAQTAVAGVLINPDEPAAAAFVPRSEFDEVLGAV
jgi:hypothetical protein